MKVLHVITGLGAGGAEQQLRLLLRHLPGTHDVVTLTNPGQVADGLRRDGVRVTHLGMAGNRDGRALPRLVRLIRAGRYDLVHTHLYRACLYGRIAARLAGVRAVVATEHSLGDTQIEGRPLTRSVRALYRTGERLGRTTIAVSPAVADRLAAWGVARDRVRIVPNGVDVPRFAYDPDARAAARKDLGLPADAYVVGGVGRLVEGKRFGVLIEALRELPDDVHLLLVGTGPQEETLRRAARHAGVSGRVVLAGERPHIEAERTGALDLPALLSAMDLLASPSSDEAFGLAVVEAQASGLPVLYVTCPAVDDLPPGTGARAVRVPGDATSFVREIRETCELPRSRTEPGGARQPSPAALHYSIARSAALHHDVYVTAAGAPTSGVST
ncbi:glycosyltransferase [Streptomyces sp. NPDC059639]|uniref:glycosyltransferase n=1 Tax=Streptomyces sp. NPDC059639 TaxID=3346891 RepID=UPI00367866D3